MFDHTSSIYCILYSYCTCEPARTFKCVFVCAFCECASRILWSTGPSAVFGCGWIKKDQDQQGEKETDRLHSRSGTAQGSAALQRAQCNPDQPIRGSTVWREVLHPGVSRENRDIFHSLLPG